MNATLIDGNELASRLRKRAADRVDQLAGEGTRVRMDAVIVGQPPAGALFARSQQARCAEVGIEYELHTLPAGAGQSEIERTIETLNADPNVTGIMLNLPLPDEVDTPAVQYRIDPYKDVEGVNPANIGMLFYDCPIIAPCTALAVMEVLKVTNTELRGRHVVVVGQGAVVGRPITLSLMQQDATVTACNKYTPDLAACTRQADVLVVAAGVPGLIGGDHIKPGAIVIDVGINRLPVEGAPGQSQTVGDVVFEEARHVAGWLTPVPGGVGPVTVAILLYSVVEAARQQRLGRRIIS